MTTHAPGTPIWVDLGTPDVERAKKFYEALFGWTSTVATEPEAGGYTTFSKKGKPVAAVGPLQSEEQPPAWTTYLLTEDSEATAAKVEAAGGKVVLAPMDVLKYGRMAVFMDQAGAVFATWQPGSMVGAELFNEPGSLAWTELTTRDPEGAKAFYGDVFGWMPDDKPSGPITYTTWRLGGRPIGGMMPMEGDQWPADLPPHWMVYFAVANPDTTASKAKKLGGTVSVPPTDTPAGRFAVLGDPAGAFFSIIKVDPKFMS
jgi:predicted enzyme related to lactoylglutathione lyase